jgi:predicted Rossmann fold nucleotide-binding protein DprA/Smf involved in DNA uptake
MVNNMKTNVTGRQIITYLAMKYHNNWRDIYTAINNKELVDPSIIHDSIATLRGDVVLIIDSNYPDALKKIPFPPFAIFMDKHDRTNINDNSSIDYLHHFETADAVLGA